MAEITAHLSNARRVRIEAHRRLAAMQAQRAFPTIWMHVMSALTLQEPEGEGYDPICCYWELARQVMAEFVAITNPVLNRHCPKAYRQFTMDVLGIG